ncbi:MAG: hypothetical protein AAF074_04200 [Pseudomonadota bacterium]
MRAAVRLPAAAMIALALLLAACAEPRTRVSAVSTLEAGTIVRIEPVAFGDDQSLADDGAGVFAGATTGLVIGSAIGSSIGNNHYHHGHCCYGGNGLAGALIGLAAGALIGAIIDNSVDGREGVQYFVALDSGEEIVVLAVGAPEFTAGARVLVAVDDAGPPRLFPA